MFDTGSSMSRRFTFIDLFAGAGGFSAGFLQAVQRDARFDFLLASDIKGDGLISVGDLLCSSVNLASVAPSDFSGLGGD